MTDASAWNARMNAAAEQVNYANLDSSMTIHVSPTCPLSLPNGTESRSRTGTTVPDLTTLYAAFDEAMSALNWRPIETK